MNNKQVIAVFIIGIVLLLGAFWAGRYVVKQDPAAAGTPAAAGPAPQAERNAKPAPTGNQATASTSTPAEQPAPAGGRYVVQVGAAYGTAAQASQAVAELREKYKSAYVQNPVADYPLYRVRIGPYNSREDAQQVANDLASQGRKGVMIFPWTQN